MQGKRWPFQNYKQVVMIYHLTPNEVRNTYCPKLYLYTKFVLAKKKNNKSHTVEMYLAG